MNALHIELDIMALECAELKTMITLHRAWKETIHIVSQDQVYNLIVSTNPSSPLYLPPLICLGLALVVSGQDWE